MTRENGEKCTLPSSLDLLNTVYVEKVYTNGTKTILSREYFDEFVRQINKSWMNLSKKESLALVILKKCLVKGRGIFYCQDTKVCFQYLLFLPHLTNKSPPIQPSFTWSKWNMGEILPFLA